MELQPDLLLTIFMVALAFAAAKYLPRLMAGVPFVDPSAVKARLDSEEDVVVVDVRTEGEFMGGHIPGAVNMPLGHIPMRLREIKDDLAALKDIPVVVHCRTENRSTRAVRVLKRSGLANLSVMNGGFRRWQKENLPVAFPGMEAEADDEPETEAPETEAPKAEAPEEESSDTAAPETQAAEIDTKRDAKSANDS